MEQHRFLNISFDKLAFVFCIFGCLKPPFVFLDSRGFFYGGPVGQYTFQRTRQFRNVVVFSRMWLMALRDTQYMLQCNYTRLRSPQCIQSKHIETDAVCRKRRTWVISYFGHILRRVGVNKCNKIKWLYSIYCLYVVAKCQGLEGHLNGTKHHRCY